MAQTGGATPALLLVQHHGHGAGHERASAATARIGSMVIERPWSRATPGGAKVAVGYMRIVNQGAAPDRLIGGSLPVAAGFELHETSMTDGVMRMRPLAQGLEIGAGETMELKPGGDHVMFTGLRAPLEQGQAIKGTLVFEKAGTVEIEYRVESIGAADASGHHGPAH